ncbi:MAG: MgtC/SapB family protein [candidate division WOR-3 bacterium]
MSSDLNDLDFIIRIFLSLVIGALIGLERQYRNRHAGMRTFAILSMASALIAMVGLLSAKIFGNSDIPYITVAIILSMGFLGAGVIYREKTTMVIIHGLTTSTTLLMTAIIGLAIGLGFIKHALISFLITLVALLILRRIELKTGLKKIIPEQELRE